MLRLASIKLIRFGVQSIRIPKQNGKLQHTRFEIYHPMLKYYFKMAHHSLWNPISCSTASSVILHEAVILNCKINIFRAYFVQSYY